MMINEDLNSFNDFGYVLVRDHIKSVDLQILQTELSRLIDLKLAAEGIRSGDSESMDVKFNLLLRTNRVSAGHVYSASKKLSAFARQVSSIKNEELARKLIGSDFVAFSDRGWGLRIDSPGESKFSTPLHQDYHTQLGSLDGIVISTPLTDVTMEMGPLIIYPRSHHLGLLNAKEIQTESASTDLDLDVSSVLIDKYPPIQPEVKSGDAVVINFQLLHKSGINNSSRSRFSLLSRWFNLNDSAAISRGWHGGIQEGYKFLDVHPN
jgi:hypothetical protein